MKLASKHSNNNSKYLFCTLSILGGLIITTLVSGLVLSSTLVSADDSIVDEIRITVPIACSLSASGTNSHNATINNGQYNSAIGGTTMKAFCNDNEGFTIYAVGFTDDEAGKNVLSNSTLGSNHDIATGTAISGDTSNWAMKLAASSGTYAPIIAGSSTDTERESGDPDFTSFQAIPNKYTKVAYRTSNTDVGTNAEGSTLTTTYQAYISPTQAAGAYSGKVKYTMVHPNDADAPTPFDGETLQSVSNWASMVAMGQTVTVPDARDNEEYTVARLVDGRLWLTKNLRLDLNTYYDKITPENTNNPTQAFLDELAINHAPTNTGDWSTLDYDSTLPGWHKNTIRYNDQEIGDMTTDDWGHTHDEYGIYYNWYTATAGNGTYEMNQDSDPATGDLCPSGWHLPTAQGRNYLPNGNYGELFIALGGHTDYSGAAQTADYSTQPSGWEMAERLRAEPNNMTMAGFYYDGELRHFYTEYWSSTPETSTGVYTLAIATEERGITWPGHHQDYGYKYTGHAMRCIANRLSHPFTVKYAPGVISVSVDGVVVQDGQSITLEEASSHKIEVELAQGYAVDAWQANGGSISNTTAKSADFKMGFTPSVLTISTVNYPIIQDVEDWGTSVEQGQTIETIDIRDNSVYTVARLADGKLWMTKNLRLNLAEANITTQNTNNPSAQFINGLNDLNSAVNTAWCTNNNSTCIDQIKYNSSNIGDSTVDSSGHTYDEYGIYYNWYTATAGNGVFSTNNYSVVSGDICPSGWHLPKGTNTSESPPWEWTGDYWELSIAQAGLKPEEVTVENYNQIMTSENNSKIKLPPSEFLLSGSYFQNGKTSLGEIGIYWSSLSYRDGNAYTLIVRPEQSSNPLGTASDEMYRGASIRCLTE